MKLHTIENDVMHLSRQDRARLIRKLIISLDAPSEQELQAEWLAEARHRAKELDSGTVKAVPGREVLSKARALIQ